MLYYDEAASGHAEPTLCHRLMRVYVCVRTTREIVSLLRVGQWCTAKVTPWDWLVRKWHEVCELGDAQHCEAPVQRRKPSSTSPLACGHFFISCVLPQAWTIQGLWIMHRAVETWSVALFGSRSLVPHLFLERSHNTTLIICEMSSNVTLSRICLRTHYSRHIWHVRTFAWLTMLLSCVNFLKNIINGAKFSRKPCSSEVGILRYFLLPLDIIRI
jgi:hypothetical protein